MKKPDIKVCFACVNEEFSIDYSVFEEYWMNGILAECPVHLWGDTFTFLYAVPKRCHHYDDHNVGEVNIKPKINIEVCKTCMKDYKRFHDNPSIFNMWVDAAIHGTIINCKVGNSRQSIHKEPPQDCPFRLEHLVSQED
jgi:hypothetical protein